MECCLETLEAWIARFSKSINTSSSIGVLEDKLVGGPEEPQPRLGANELGQERSGLHIKATSVFRWEPVIDIIEDIVTGLVFIHEHGTAHRDLKPRNGPSFSIFPLLTLVLYSEQYKCWKIADFGTASTATSKRLNTTRYARGTAGYRAPEILVKEAKYIGQRWMGFRKQNSCFLSDRLLQCSR